MNRKIASALHKRLWPHLQALGFQYHIGRSYYRLLEGQVWQFSSRAVGYYFSLMTDHPAHAFCAQMGIYPFEAAEQPYVERSLNERKPYWGYAGRDSLDLQALDISVQYREQTFRPEAERTDLWAVAPDGSNLDAVLADFEQAFLQQAPAWWQQVQNPEHIAQSLAHRASTQYVWAKKAREDYFKAVQRGREKKAARHLEDWYGFNPLDYYLYWDAHGGDPLRTTQSDKP